MQRMLEEMLNEVNIKIDGEQPFDIQVNDPQLYVNLLKKQSIGAGESYMEGHWDCNQLDELFYRICDKEIHDKIYSNWNNLTTNLHNSIFNQQSRRKAVEVAEVHYNLGNKLFELMLGPSMAYTCGYWKNAHNLDEAQFAKYDLVCKKLMLKPKEKILELGCGWGGLAKYMAKHYGCEVVAFDIGHEPANYAKELCKDLPVQIYESDYRDTAVYNPTNQKFDKLVSVGVLEHIGYKNYDLFLQICRSFIKEDGLFLLHSIGGNTSRKFCEPWINKYIFPNGMLPSLKQLGSSFEKKFVVEDFHNFGQYYYKTLLAWNENLNNHWKELENDYDERFHRMMNYYLLSCAGGFKARSMQLWQFVLTPKGMRKDYNSVR